MSNKTKLREDPYLLLDSSLKSATKNSRKFIKEHRQELYAVVDDKPRKYDYKVVVCGDYIQVYYYANNRIKNPKKDDNVDLNLKKMVDNSKDEDNLKSINEIEFKNITRSKLQCQRIAKANMKYWETFITLTFADNVTDIKIANKRLKYFFDKVRRVKKDFRYLGIPEYQKRGAIHYHILTNISINDTKLMYEQEDNPKFKHIKYWLDGFTSVEPIKGDGKKVVGYISKYMTKDIDNRLFGHNRFFYSQNCLVPKISYIDSMDSEELEFLQKKIQDKELIYQSRYINAYDGSEVSFQEFLLPDNIISEKKLN